MYSLLISNTDSLFYGVRARANQMYAIANKYPLATPAPSPFIFPRIYMLLLVDDQLHALRT